MAFARYERTLVDDQGNVIRNATVEVRREAPGFPLAVPLYQDFAGASGQSNPITVTDGTLAFHVVGDWYRLDVTAPGYSKTFRYVAIGTAAASDVDAYTAAGFTWAPESSTSSPPSTGCLRGDDADASAWTHVYVSTETLGGSTTGVADWLLGLDPGSKTVPNRLMLAVNDGREASWEVVSVTDHTTWVDIEVDDGTYAGPVSPVSLGDSGFISLAREISGPNGAGGGGGGSSGNTVIETGNGPFTVADDTEVLILNRGAPGTTSVVLGSVDDRAGMQLYIYDWAGNAGDITITPDGAETIMGASTWTLGSSADGKAAFHLIPNTDLPGWLAGA